MSDGTQNDPIFIKPVVESVDGRALFRSMLLTVVPIAIALLMQKPALRQRVAMEATHRAKTFCQIQADFWQDMALRSATMYNRARL